MALKYSIQSSSLSPDGVTDPYGRFMVQYREPLEADTLTIADEEIDVDTIAAALQEGRPITIKTSLGVEIGQLLTTLKGGFLISDDPTPTSDQIGIGFRPSVSVLSSTRFEPVFERIDTVVRNPSITLVSDWYQNERTDNAISINGGHSNYVEIRGSNFKLDTTLSVTLTEIGGDELSVQLADDVALIKWTDRLIAFNAKQNMITPETTGTLTVNVGSKSTSTTVTIIDQT